MPLAHVYWNDDSVLPEVVQNIIVAIPSAISRAFSGEGLDWFQEDEVTVMEFRCKMEGAPEGSHVWMQNPMSHDVEVIVWANHTIRRQAEQTRIAKQMAAALRTLVPTACSGFVWLLLQPAAFADFANGEQKP